MSLDRVGAASARDVRRGHGAHHVVLGQAILDDADDDLVGEQASVLAHNHLFDKVNRQF